MSNRLSAADLPWLACQRQSTYAFPLTRSMPGLAAAASCTVDSDIHLAPALCRCHPVPRLRRQMLPLAGGAWRALGRMRSVCRKRTSCLRASAPGCKSQGRASLRPSTSTAPQFAHVLDCLRRPPAIPFQLCGTLGQASVPPATAACHADGHAAPAPAGGAACCSR